MAETNKAKTPSRSTKAKKVKAAYERLFESEDGKVVLYDLIQSTGLLAPSIDLGRQVPSGIELAFNDGAKSVVGRIIQQIQLTPEAFLKMVEQSQTNEEFQL